ncbi:MAG: type II secretion system F family protein [Mariniblastus sp.]
MTPLELCVFCCLTASFLATTLVIKRVMSPAEAIVPKLKRLPGRISFPNQEGTGAPGIDRKLDLWLHRSVRRSGWKITPVVFMASNCCLAICVGVALLSTEFHEGIAAVGAISTFVLGLVAIQIAVRRRQKKFNEHFPASLELLARSVASGESLEDSIELIAEAVQEPVREEFQHCAKQLQMGGAVQAVMSDFAVRVPTMDVRIFAHTVAMHRDTGGRLSDTLTRLANVIRERNEYLKKIRTMTGLGRFAAITIGYMGVFVLVYLCVFHHDYVGKLWASDLGQRMAIYGIASEICGIIWVALTLKSDGE